jgi:mono/diheme cytochrome c family protein
VKLRVPLLVKLGALVVATTGFYTYVGQMVPQKEVYPPKETLIKADITTAEMTTIGKEIFEGKGLCTTCHTIGKKAGPFRFPDLENVAVRAKTREPGLSDIDYFAQTMYEPDAFIVPGFNPGMPPINKPPIGLTDQEILCVMAFLQSLGGTPSVTLATTHHYLGPGAAVTASASAPAAPSAGAAQTQPPPGKVAAPAGVPPDVPSKEPGK